MQHYYAVAEPDEAGGFWISFPGRDGIASAASSAVTIVGQARDALESVLMHPPADLPLSIEDGAKPPADLSNYDPQAIVVIIPFEASRQPRPPDAPPGELACGRAQGVARRVGEAARPAQLPFPQQPGARGDGPAR